MMTDTKKEEQAKSHYKAHEIRILGPIRKLSNIFSALRTERC